MLDSRKPTTGTAQPRDDDTDRLTDIVDGLIERLNLRASTDRASGIGPSGSGSPWGHPHSVRRLAASGNPRPASDRRDGEFVGRQHELAALRDFLVHAARRGAHLSWSGTPGIGKTVVLDAAVRLAANGTVVLRAAPADHPWRTMPHQGMTPHVSCTTRSTQTRYSAGAREILECWFEHCPIRDEYLIVDSGRLAGTGALSYTV